MTVPAPNGHAAHVLLTVAKWPQPGETKTRLQGEFTAEEAALIYRCLLLDTFRLMAQVRSEGILPVVAFTPPAAVDRFRRLAPAQFGLLPQRGRDLGERLANALGDSLAMPGVRRAVIMNSDGPTLPVACLQEAFDALAHADVTLGPGMDGGYYLIGMSQLHTGLFEDVTWSTAHVLEQTLCQARRLGLSVHLLPPWYDVDFAPDLRQILVAGPEAAPQTYAYVTALRPQWLRPKIAVESLPAPAGGQECAD